MRRGVTQRRARLSHARLLKPVGVSLGPMSGLPWVKLAWIAAPWVSRLLARKAFGGGKDGDRDREAVMKSIVTDPNVLSTVVESATQSHQVAPVLAANLYRAFSQGEAFSRRQLLQPLEKAFYGDAEYALSTAVPPYSIRDDGSLGDHTYYAERALNGGLWDSIKNIAKKVVGAVAPVVQKVGSAVSKVASFIPGVGTAISAVSGLASKAAGAVNRLIGGSDSSESSDSAASSPSLVVGQSGQAGGSASDRLAYAAQSPIGERAYAKAVDAAKELLNQPTSEVIAGDPVEMTPAQVAAARANLTAMFRPATLAPVLGSVPAAGDAVTGDSGEVGAPLPPLDTAALFQQSLGDNVMVTKKAEQEILNTLVQTGGPQTVSKTATGADLGFIDRLPAVWNLLKQWTTTGALPNLRMGMWWWLAPGAATIYGAARWASDKMQGISRLSAKQLSRAVISAMDWWQKHPSEAARDWTQIIAVVAANLSAMLSARSREDAKPIRDLLKSLTVYIPVVDAKRDAKALDQLAKGHDSGVPLSDLGTQLEAAYAIVWALVMGRHGQSMPGGAELTSRQLSDVLLNNAQAIGTAEYAEKGRSVAEQFFDVVPPVRTDEVEDMPDDDDDDGNSNDTSVDPSEFAGPTVRDTAVDSDLSGPQDVDVEQVADMLKSQSEGKVKKWLIGIGLTAVAATALVKAGKALLSVMGVGKPKDSAPEDSTGAIPGAPDPSGSESDPTPAPAVLVEVLQ